MASKEALKSTFPQHRLGAVIVKGGRVISTGYNKMSYSKELRKSNIHAEEAAILKLLKAKRQGDLVGAEIYVSRFTPSGRISLAKPCSDCLALVRACGIKRYYYTDSEGSTKSGKVR